MINSLIDHRYTLAKPGICRGNEDSCRNENQKSQEKIFSMGEKIDNHTCFSMKFKMMDL